MIRYAVATLAILAVIASPPPARGDDIAEAKARFKKGAELYRAHKWREAIAEFEAAYRLKPAGAIHFNIAQCRERLSEWPGALRAYHDYLREVPDATDRAAVRASIGRIESRLAATGVQALLLYSDPPGAAIVLDGRPRGTTPFHIVLPPGSYELALSLDGYEPMKEEVTLPAATSRAVDVVLRHAAPAPSPPVAAAAPAPTARSAAGSAVAIPQVPLPPPPDLKVQPPKASASDAFGTKAFLPKPAEKRRVYTWIAAGAAVAALAAGGYFEYAAQKDASAVRDSSAPSPVTTAYQSWLDGKIADGKSKRRTGYILFATGAGAAAAGVTLFFLEKRF